MQEEATGGRFFCIRPGSVDIFTAVSCASVFDQLGCWVAIALLNVGRRMGEICPQVARASRLCMG